MKNLAGSLLPVLLLSACVPAYETPPGLTPQTGASIVGIYDQRQASSFLVPNETHICVLDVDGKVAHYPGWILQKCDVPLLISAGPHEITLLAEFTTEPVQSGQESVSGSFVSGGTYFIHADGGPIAFKNADGTISEPQQGVATVWIASASGVPIAKKIAIPLQNPEPTGVPVFIPVK